MKTARIALYVLIALIAIMAALYVLTLEPHPDWPINLIHLLFKH
ncbi:hypothetical protein [Geobacter sulfurreducens]|nr:hypothetical protein [Geobacter sulfurreducens]ADI85444.1 hypothetical protein KN400_2632 [Geobacter sulfurreducens KN400]